MRRGLCVYCRQTRGGYDDDRLVSFKIRDLTTQCAQVANASWNPIVLAVMKIHLSKSLTIFLIRDRLLAVFSVLMIGESQSVLGDGREIGECETKGSQPLRSKTSFRHYSPAYVISKQGETDMGDTSKKDKDKKQQQQKDRLSTKEKRKLKNEKKLAAK